MNTTSKQQLKAIAVAFIFSSRVPMPVLDEIKPEDSSRSLPWFLLVGATLGILLSGISYLFSDTNPLVVAALLVACNAIYTGALHLDGVADSADAWLGGLGDKERTLEIMKDPRCGSGAVVTLICLLLLQWAVFSEIIQQQQWVLLFIAPVIGRAALLSIFMSTPYARPQGLASDFLAHANRALITLLIALTVGFSLLLSFNYLIPLIITTVIIGLCRHLMIKRLDGFTGDTAGAMVEVGSTIFLLGCVLF